MFGRLIIVLCLILSFIGCSHFDSQVFEKNSENVRFSPVFALFSQSCIHSLQHAKQTASAFANGSKTFCRVWIPLRQDRLIRWSPGRNNVVNELGLVLWRGNVVGRSSSSDGIHFVAISPFENLPSIHHHHGAGWALTPIWIWVRQCGMFFHKP